MVLIDSYDLVSPPSIIAIGRPHPSADSQVSSRGQTFQLGSDTYTLTSAKFRMRKTGSPTGNFVATLWSHTGTFGTDGKPGTLLATSDDFDISVLTTSLALYEFTFSGDEQYEMQPNTEYCISLQNKDVAYDGTNYVEHGRAGSDVITGNAIYFSISAWKEWAWDVCFYLYGDLVAPNPTQRALKFMPIHGWESGEEEYLKVKASSAGVLNTS